MDVDLLLLLRLSAVLDLAGAIALLYVSMAVINNLERAHVGRLRAVPPVLAFGGAFVQILLAISDIAFGVSLPRVVFARIVGALILIVAWLLMRATFRRADTTMGARRDAILRSMEPRESGGH